MILYGIPVAWSAYLVFDYACADSGSGFTGLFPPEMRLYVLVISLALVIGGAYAGAWRILSGPKIEGDIRIEGGRLQMTVLRGNRMEPVDLEIHELTFVENDEERMRVASSKGNIFSIAVISYPWMFMKNSSRK